MRPARTLVNGLPHLPRLRLILGLVLAVAVCGCSTIRGTPERYQATQAIVAAIDLTPGDIASLVTATTRDERNALQNKTLAVIDLQFHEFVRNLSADRSDSSTAVAGTTLGASTAGAFVESVKAKTNYALFGAGVVGAFGIVDKNYFYEKTVPALVAAMGAARASILVRIRNGQAEALTSYDGVAALQDIEDYFSAGTVLSAIAEITARADSDKKDALTEIRSLEVPDDAEIANRKNLTRATFAIKDKDSMEKGNKALKALGLTAQTTPRDTGLALRRAMRPPTKDRLATVEKALKDAGLLQ
jgi:hypothetical protein